MWTLPNHHGFVALTVHFKHNRQPFSMLLDFFKVSFSYTGFNLATVFATILEEFGIEHKILGVTCNNASPNIVIVEALSDVVKAFPVKTIVYQFDIKKEKADEGLDKAE
ncbi:hypothetical protein C0995_004344 [Termitomyces sp. Mi166|nr:hypothetical protein C0995_004344 [Termitomyces sp. Mi166\